MKKPYDHGYVCHLFEAVMEIVIPNTLAEERFENLQLEAFFMRTFDILVSFAYIIKYIYASLSLSESVVYDNNFNIFSYMTSW